MSRLRTFYYADGRTVRVPQADYDRKVRAQAAAAARHGLVRVENSRGRPQLLTPARAVAYQARQAAARTAPRDEAGRLLAGVRSTKAQARQAVALGQTRAPAPVYLDGPEGLVRDRGDFSRWVGATLDQARALGVSPLQGIQVTLTFDGGGSVTRTFAFDPRPSTAPEDLRWPEQVHTWAQSAARHVAQGGDLSTWDGALTESKKPYPQRADNRPSTTILDPGDLPGGVGAVLAAGGGVEDDAPPVSYEISAEYV